MTLESRHDFSSNQSKKPFFSPGCARATRAVFAAGQSSRVFSHRRVAIQEIPPLPDRIPTLGDPEGDDRSIGSSSVRPSARPSSSRVDALGRRDTEKSHPRPTRARPHIASVPRRDRRTRPRSIDAIDRGTTLLSLGLGYATGSLVDRTNARRDDARDDARTLPPTFFLACMRLVPDVFAAFTTTRVAETANMVVGRSVGRSRSADAAIDRSIDRGGGWRWCGGGRPIGTRRGDRSSRAARAWVGGVIVCDRDGVRVSLNSGHVSWYGGGSRRGTTVGRSVGRRARRRPRAVDARSTSYTRARAQETTMGRVRTKTVKKVREKTTDDEGVATSVMVDGDDDDDDDGGRGWMENPKGSRRDDGRGRAREARGAREAKIAIVDRWRVF